MIQEVFGPNDEVLYLKYYKCRVIRSTKSYNSNFMYIIEDLNTKKHFVVHENDLELVEK